MAPFDRDGVIMIRDFVHTLCDRNQTETEVLLNWMSQMLVSPETKPDKAIAIFGPRGCGKGVFGHLLRSLLGTTKVIDTSRPDWDVWGRFNDGMAGSLLVHIIDEGVQLDLGALSRMYRRRSDVR